MRIALPARIDPEAVARRDPTVPIVTLDGETMGTSWRVMFACPPRVTVRAIHAGICARLDRLVAEMSHWQGDSLLSRFNRAPPGSWTALPADFAHVIAAGLRIAAASDGAFDPAIGRLVDAWGYGPPGPCAPPDATALAAARAGCGWQRLRFDPYGRRLYQPGGVALDLSAIAKGHAADALAALLAASGLHDALVEVGGELVGRGIRPDGEPWWVDLETPPGAPLPPLRIALHGLAVATSGNYRRGDHTLDPRTSRPAGKTAAREDELAEDVVSVSVIGESAMEADAWATALTVLGSQRGCAAALAAALAARIVVSTGDGVTEHLSPRLAAMLGD